MPQEEKKVTVEKTVFETLREIDLSSKHKQKGKLAYLPWATAWSTVKLTYPDARYAVIRDEDGQRFHVEGKTCFVETQITIKGETIGETLAVMDSANRAILAADVTSTNIDKSIKRCLTKNLALFGLDLNLWEGEELSDEAKELNIQKAEADKKAKSTLSKAVKEVVDLGNDLIKAGINKDVLFGIIEKHNEGNQNPASLKTVEACAAVKAELLEVKKTLPTGKEDKK